MLSSNTLSHAAQAFYQNLVLWYKKNIKRANMKDSIVTEAVGNDDWPTLPADTFKMRQSLV